MTPIATKPPIVNGKSNASGEPSLPVERPKVLQCPKCQVWGQECAYGAPCESSYSMADQSGYRAYQMAYNDWLGTEAGQAWEEAQKSKRGRYYGFVENFGRSGGEL